jgi:anti-sigma B factor antagonist/stage II sporulation protein AA (anti-sigma F factor antagonist)
MELGPRRFAETVVLSPAGRIDHATAEGFKTALLGELAACAPGRDRVVLDLGGVEYIASVGLRALMLAARQAKAQGSTLVVAALQPLVREVFEISRFTLLFSVYPTVRDALVALSPDALVAFDAAALA